jgi:hypothetical protein
MLELWADFKLILKIQRESDTPFEFILDPKRRYWIVRDGELECELANTLKHLFISGDGKSISYYDMMNK